MELHPVHGPAPVLEPHDLAVVGPGGDLQLFRQILPAHRQRMVAGRGEGAGDVLEQALAGVVNLAGLAVHQRLGADHFPAIGLADRLVAEADPQDRQLRRRGAQQRQADPRLIGRAGPGRQDHPLRPHRQRVLHRDLVVAPDSRLRPQLVHIVDEVVGEAVVVIDHQDHAADVEPGARLAKLRRGIGGPADADQEPPFLPLIPAKAGTQFFSVVQGPQELTTDLTDSGPRCASLRSPATGSAPPRLSSRPEPCLQGVEPGSGLSAGACGDPG